jgi:asparagine synthase (glutamine-hydrolysing)
MCGICGVAPADFEARVEPARLRRITRILTHRGPDDEGYYQSPGIALGMRRLSIIDLDTGRQPMTNEDGSLVLICNGEIYNYKELRRELLGRGHRFKSHSDAEVVLHLYEDLGPECLSRLRGMFALALWEKKRKRLMLARDRFGIKPLYYVQTCGGELIFGSEVKALIASGTYQPSLDPIALNSILSSGWPIMPRSIFKGVSQIRPAHYMLFKGGKCSTYQYWDVSFDPGREGGGLLDEAYWQEALADKLAETVRLHMRSDVEVGTWLSPGLDSSGITAIAASMASKPVRAFSLGFKGSKEADELGRFPTLEQYSHQNILAYKADCEARHLELMPRALWFREEPNNQLVFVARYLISQISVQKVKVALTGEGADEIFGGYPWYIGDRLLRSLSHLPKSLRLTMSRMARVERWRPGLNRFLCASNTNELNRFRHIVGTFPNGYRHGLIQPDFQPNQPEMRAEYEGFKYPAGFNAWHPFARMQYVETKTRLPGTIVLGLDRMAMAFSLETRVPFLDHELVELSARIPIALRLKRLKEKYILRRALSRWLPREIVQRPKRSMIAPNQQWWRGRLPDFAQELLSTSGLKQKGYFNHKAVHRLLAEHRCGMRDWSRPLIAVLGLQLWDELFVSNSMKAGDKLSPATN